MRDARPGGEDRSVPSEAAAAALYRRGLRLEYATIAWNVMEVFVTIGLGIAAGSLALVAFGLDSLVEVFASLVVVWHMRGSDSAAAPDLRNRRAMRLVALAFAVLALYLFVASARSIIGAQEADSSPAGIAYLGVTAIVMFALARVKRRTAIPLASAPLHAEATMTFLDGFLATGVLSALALNTLFGWWWADPAAAATLGVFSAREAREAWRGAL